MTKTREVPTTHTPANSRCMHLQWWYKKTQQDGRVKVDLKIIQGYTLLIHRSISRKWKPDWLST
jgi:hypothetical protein